MLLAAFTGRYPTNHLGAVSDRLLGVERTLTAGETLADHFGVFID